MTPKLRRLSLWLAPLAAMAVTVLMMNSGWAREGALVGGLTVLCGGSLSQFRFPLPR
jgi:sodium-dependent dicarboxylate transporter 2/3/5